MIECFFQNLCLMFVYMYGLFYVCVEIIFLDFDFGEFCCLSTFVRNN